MFHSNQIALKPRSLLTEINVSLLDSVDSQTRDVDISSRNTQKASVLPLIELLWDKNVLICLAIQFAITMTFTGIEPLFALHLKVLRSKSVQEYLNIILN